VAGKHGEGRGKQGGGQDGDANQGGAVSARVPHGVPSIERAARISQTKY
jgi:hypothetical protein